MQFYFYKSPCSPVLGKEVSAHLVSTVVHLRTHARGHFLFARVRRTHNAPLCLRLRPRARGSVVLGAAKSVVVSECPCLCHLGVWELERMWKVIDPVIPYLVPLGFVRAGHRVRTPCRSSDKPDDLLLPVCPVTLVRKYPRRAQ